MVGEARRRPASYAAMFGWASPERRAMWPGVRPKRWEVFPELEEERDPDREAQIVARMAARAPDLGEEALARIMHTVISASLDAVREREEPPDERS